ncbi:hypothetical protein HAZT_HAZT001653 [Hyalella azteca]|uniref:Rad50/SbcC-type AAA domain-containing protein n=1 Tax=Hyalella azteca TaxID=294128 RepID=A0A6A0HA11_HYAAZ|nr:hypothetical protein HAZT_HAZT001653 [Hyalella azteca]
MSRIQKLRLQGIRSFGPEKPQEIKFKPPLTLILGQNGCGKTTIIEALKYITTGEKPPGSNGGRSFVHDPKISREVKSRGQIKLRVITAAGEKFDLVRSVEVVQKPQGLKFESLDQTITRTGPDGQKIQVSNKINWNLAALKNIFRKVILAVWFQEDSNWPLDEGKKVKEKFDAIFNATRYIKGLETMRKLRAEKKQQMINMTETLESLKDMKDEADRKKTELATQQGLLDQIKEAQDNFSQRKRPLLKRIQEIEEVEHGIAKISHDLGESNVILFPICVYVASGIFLAHHKSYYIKF